MLLYGATSVLSSIFPQQEQVAKSTGMRYNSSHRTYFRNVISCRNGRSLGRRWCAGAPSSISTRIGFVTTIAALTAFMLSVGGTKTNAIEIRSSPQQQQSSEETLLDIPQMLSSDCSSSSSAKGCKKARIQRPKSRKAESCTVKCVTTCIRGGVGSPGEGPLNIRRPIVVFKEGFRSRQYCLVECSDICNLISDGDNGP